MKITVGNIKGGVAKTTTAIFLALELARTGERVLLIDADPEQQSALNWSEEATEEWPANCVVMPCATRDLAKRVDQLAKDFDHLIIDTSPKNPLLLRQALSISDHMVVPVAPRSMELRELSVTFALAEEIKVTHSLDVSVLLVQVRRGTRSIIEARKILEEMDYPILANETHFKEEYALAFGRVPAITSEYHEVMQEIRNKHDGMEQ